MLTKNLQNVKQHEQMPFPLAKAKVEKSSWLMLQNIGNCPIIGLWAWGCLTLREFLENNLKSWQMSSSDDFKVDLEFFLMNPKFRVWVDARLESCKVG